MDLTISDLLIEWQRQRIAALENENDGVRTTGSARSVRRWKRSLDLGAAKRSPLSGHLLSVTP
jgi:hypothetical protein